MYNTLFTTEDSGKVEKNCKQLFSFKDYIMFGWQVMGKVRVMAKYD